MIPQSDTVTVFLALFAMIGTVATLVVNAYILTRVGKVATKTDETHDLVNGLSHDLNTAQVGQAKAEGITQGEQDQRDRTVGGEK